MLSNFVTGLLGTLQGAGEVAAKQIEADKQASLEELRSRLAGARESAGRQENAGIARDVAAARPANMAAETEAVGTATEKVAAANADAQRGRRAADTTSTLETTLNFNTNPDTVARVAKADSDKLGLTREARMTDAAELAKSAAATQTLLGQDKDYLKSREAINRVENPQHYSAVARDLAAATLSGLQAKAAQQQFDAKDAYAKAVDSKDPAKIADAERHLKAVQKDTAADRVEQTSLASVYKTLESEGVALETRRTVAMEKATLQGPEAVKAEEARFNKLTAANATEKATVLARYKEVAGIKDADKPAGPATPKTQADMDKLEPGSPYVDPRDGKTYTKKGAAATPAVGTAVKQKDDTVMLPPGAASPNEKINADRQARLRAEEEKVLADAAAKRSAAQAADTKKVGLMNTLAR